MDTDEHRFGEENHSPAVWLQIRFICVHLYYYGRNSSQAAIKLSLSLVVSIQRLNFGCGFAALCLSVVSTPALLLTGSVNFQSAGRIVSGR